jgi:hypothetical protein
MSREAKGNADDYTTPEAALAISVAKYHREQTHHVVLVTARSCDQVRHLNGIILSAPCLSLQFVVPFSRLRQFTP